MTRARIASLVAAHALAIFAAATSLGAQSYALELGTRIRVTHPAGTTEGVLIRTAGDTLELDQDGVAKRIAGSNVLRVDRSIGKAHNRTSGVLVGAAAGVGIAAITVASNVTDIDQCASVCTYQKGNARIFAMVGFGAAGGLIGYGVGSLTSHDIWEPVRPGVSVAPMLTPSGHMGLALRWAHAM